MWFPSGATGIVRALTALARLIIHPETLAHRSTVSLGWPFFSKFVRFGQFVVNHNSAFRVSMRSLFFAVYCLLFRNPHLYHLDPAAHRTTGLLFFVSSWLCVQSIPANSKTVKLFLHPKCPADSRNDAQTPASARNCFSPSHFVKKPVLP